MSQSFLKDPSSVLDYAIDWSTWLASVSPADTISTSNWSAETGITVDSNSTSGGKVIVWLSGGTAGKRYAVTNTIVTAGGRTAERTIYVIVRQR